MKPKTKNWFYVSDRYGNILRKFSSKEEAKNYKFVMGRFDWQIKEVCQFQRLHKMRTLQIRIKIMETKKIMWVARDKDGSLWLFADKPKQLDGT